MAYISHENLWESEFDNNVSKMDELQDMNNNESKLEVHDTDNKDENLSTDFEPIKNEDIINTAYLDEIFFKNKRSHIIFRKKIQRIYITIQQTISRRNFDSESCWNDYSKTLWWGITW